MRFRALLFAGSIALLPLVFSACRPPTVSDAPLAQEAYVWQRAHTAAVASAVQAHAPAFDHLVVLAAEVSWKSGRVHVARVPLGASTDAFKTAPSLGLAIRVNTYSGSFAADAPAARELTALARSLLADAHNSGLRVTEFQIDFDAPERRLVDYRQWLDALRPVVAPARLTFTALPAWLKHRHAFAALASAADDYVLQVHSLDRPSSPDDLIPLCNPDAARRAVADAARFGRPFRVALPTYGYRLAFDPQGRFFAVSAEGPLPAWPAGTIIRELESDPAELAALVSNFRRQHPIVLTGIIWYRLPISGDRLNWSWPTLAAVMRGETPAARVTLEATADGSGLVEYFALNTGNAPFTGAFSSTVTWTDAVRLAADALPPFAIENETATSQRLVAPALRLPPGARQPAGWLRLDQPPASLHVSPAP